MVLSGEILSAESRFQTKLEEFFLCVFSGINLESHGLDHHRRVWRYSKELLGYPGTVDMRFSELLPRKLIIAAYIHDTGMSIDPGPKHGIHSRHFCEDFLKQNDLPLADYSDLLDAVENHDDKEYRSARKASPLLKILSVADDLDALGYIGIYRYIEIYLKRNIRFEDLGDNIIHNVKGRFNNLKKSYENIPEFLEKHQPRFELIINFFNSYNEQKKDYIFRSGTPSGYCGVAEIIEASLITGTNLKNLITNSTTTEFDEIIKQYFSNLRKELNADINEL